MPKLKAGTIFPTDAEDAQIRAGIAADPDTYEVASAEEWAQMKLFLKTLTPQPPLPEVEGEQENICNTPSPTSEGAE